MRRFTFQQLIDEGLLEIGDGYRAKNDELGGTGPIFLRAGHVSDSHIDFTDVECFHDHLAYKVRSKMSRVDDTIITTKGNSTGRTSFVTDRLPPFVYSPHLSYWRTLAPNKLCGGFLRYWSQGDEFIEQLSGMKASTDMAPYLSLTDQRRLRITLPPLEEQKGIAAVLGSLDDKIELNRRMNSTLEAMARALFQSWFVDFDPVRAKLDARKPPGLDKTTAALFPEYFDHTADSVVPKGWTRKRWGDIATLEYGKSLRDYRESGGKYRVFGTNGPIGFHDVALCKSEGIVIGRKGAYRGVHYSPEPFFVIDTAFYLKPKAALDLKWAYYELVRFDINSMDSGSAIPSTSRDDFYGIPVILPPPQIQEAFGKIVGEWFATMFANYHQSRTLATMRDTLLPKLLSGELSVAGNYRYDPIKLEFL